MGEEDVEKPHEQELGASKENVSTQSPAPASAPAVAKGSARLGAASSRERSAPWQVVEKKSVKGASKSASKGASKGASKVDRNALSARGTGSPKREPKEVKPPSPAPASYSPLLALQRRSSCRGGVLEATTGLPCSTGSESQSGVRVRNRMR